MEIRYYVFSTFIPRTLDVMGVEYHDELIGAIEDFHRRKAIASVDDYVAIGVCTERALSIDVYVLVDGVSRPSKDNYKTETIPEETYLAIIKQVEDTLKQYN